LDESTIYCPRNDFDILVRQEQGILKVFFFLTTAPSPISRFPKKAGNYHVYTGFEIHFHKFLAMVNMQKNAANYSFSPENRAVTN